MADLNTPSYRYQLSTGPPRPRRARRQCTEAELEREESACGDAERFCNHVCQCLRPKENFSKTQLKSPAKYRACADCIELGYLLEHPSGLLCSSCGWRRGHLLFPPEALRSSEPTCNWCTGVACDFFEALERWSWNIFGKYGVRRPSSEPLPSEGVTEFNNKWPWQLEVLRRKYSKIRKTGGAGSEELPAAPEREEEAEDHQECDYACRICDRTQPRSLFSATQLRGTKSDLKCLDCTQGPDWQDPEMLDPNSNPPGWHSDSQHWKQYFDPQGRLLREHHAEGVRRPMRLEHIRFKQASCSDHFRDRRPVQWLVEELRREGSDAPLVRKKSEICVCLYKGRYWTLDNRRLWALQQALGHNQLVWVKYYQEPAFLKRGCEELIRKFTTQHDGRHIVLKTRRGARNY